MVWDNSLLNGTLLFAIALLSHTLIHRYCRVNSELKLLLLIFIILPQLLLLPPLILLYPQALATILSSWVLFIALSCAYIQSYPGLVVVIPSFKILALIDQRGSEGSTFEEICRNFSAEELRDNQLQLLLDDRLAKRGPSGEITLTTRGRVLTWLFIGYRRKLCGLEFGQG